MPNATTHMNVCGICSIQFQAQCVHFIYLFNLSSKYTYMHNVYKTPEIDFEFPIYMQVMVCKHKSVQIPFYNWALCYK